MVAVLLMNRPRLTLLRLVTGSQVLVPSLSELSREISHQYRIKRTDCRLFSDQGHHSGQRAGLLDGLRVNLVAMLSGA